jgi:hypothetical protein
MDHFKKIYLLVIAILIHIVFLLSLSYGYLNSFYNDAQYRSGQGTDFYALYLAGNNFLFKQDIYDFSNPRKAVEVATGFRYLPFSAYTVGALLNFFPPKLAYWFWVTFIEFLLFLCIYLTFEMSKDKEQFYLLASMWLIFTPYYLELFMGQFSFVQASLIMGMIYGLHRGEDRIFDTCWIVSVLWKINTFLLLPLMIRLKKIRIIILCILAIYLTSIPYYFYFPSALKTFQQANFDYYYWTVHAGHFGFLTFLFVLTQKLSLDPNSLLKIVIYPGIPIAILVASVLITFMAKELDSIGIVCLWITTYFLIYKEVWEHQYVMLLPVFVILYWKYSQRFILLLYFLVAIFSPLVLIGLNDLSLIKAGAWSLFVNLLYFGSKSLPTFILYLYQVKKLIRDGGSKREILSRTT